MKKIILSIVAIATMSLSVYGQAPEGFKYQAVVRDAGGLILNNQAVGMRLTVQQGSIGGAAVYTETFSTTTNAYGLVNLEIGTGTTTDDFTMIDWSNGPYFMETAVDFLGGMTWVVMGTSQLMSVPYALYAKTSGSSIPGPQGDDGNIGADGPQGPQGDAGNVGADGPQGPQGDAGNVGADGPQGPQGDAGNVGADGPQGPQGDIGNVGATGPAGSDATNYWTQSGANVYRSSGNVGIGTSFPNTKLHVSALTGEDVFRLQINGGSTRMMMKDNGSVGIGGFFTPINSLDILGGMSIGNYYSNIAPASGLIVSGNVGIGTTTPYNKLEVDGIGGLIIGYNYANTGTGQSVALTSTWRVIQTTASPTSVTFIAPSNGKVIIEAQFHLESAIDAFSGLADVSWVWAYVALGTSSTNGNHDVTTQRKIFQNTHEDDAENHSDISTVITTEWLLTGLNAGQSYTYYLNGSGQINNAFCEIKWGNTASHPLILKVMTAP